MRLSNYLKSIEEEGDVGGGGLTNTTATTTGNVATFANRLPFTTRRRNPNKVARGIRKVKKSKLLG